MISLFVLDVDGCITEPFVTPDWATISRIRELQRLSVTDATIPELTLLTGRPYPYAEAVAQWLDIRKPFVFESGGGLFDPITHTLQFSPNFTDEIKAEQLEIRAFVEKELLTVYPGVNPEFTKHTDVGLVSLHTPHILDLFERAKKYVTDNHPNFEVHMTPVSINIICKYCHKGEGLEHISRYTGIALDAMAYIGDTSGDIKALQRAGKPFAPANAIPEVHAISESLSQETTKGVLEAYELLIAANRALTSISNP